MGKPSDNNSRFELPADLSGLSIEQLDALYEQAKAEFHAIAGLENEAEKTAQLGRAAELAEASKKITARKEAVAAERAEMQAKFDALAAQFEPTGTGPDGESEDGGEGGDDSGGTDTEPATGTSVPSTGQMVPVGGAQTASRELGGLRGATHQLNPSLSGIRANGPAQTPARQPLAITASVGMPGQFEPGARISDLATLGRLAEERARILPDAGKGHNRYVPRNGSESYGGMQIASVDRAWADKLGEQSPIEAIEAYRAQIERNRRPDAYEALVAAGGWCAPGQPYWDFFNVTCQGGEIDLPTFGVTRGGINIPTSPTVADAYTPDLGLYEAAFSN